MEIGIDMSLLRLCKYMYGTRYVVCDSKALLFRCVMRVLIRDNNQIIGAIRIDLDALELASRNLVLEEDIEFGIGKTLVQEISFCPIPQHISGAKK